MKMKPIGNRAIIKPIENPNTTESGIILTGEQGPPIQGEVLASNIETVKVGDTVLFTQYGPDKIQIDGGDYLVVTEGNILGILVNHE